MTLRPATASDEPLLRRVYAATRAEELAALPWSDEQKDAFLAMQFDAQDAHYRAADAAAEFLVIECDAEGIGRLYRWQRADELRLVDIALLPSWRNRGIGTQLLTDLLGEAEAAGKFVSLHVEAGNPARRWYRRLGFVEAEAGPVYDRLEWRPPHPKTAS